MSNRAKFAYYHAAPRRPLLMALIARANDAARAQPCDASGSRVPYDPASVFTRPEVAMLERAGVDLQSPLGTGYNRPDFIYEFQSYQTFDGRVSAGACGHCGELDHVAVACDIAEDMAAKDEGRESRSCIVKRTDDGRPVTRTDLWDPHRRVGIPGVAYLRCAA